MEDSTKRRGYPHVKPQNISMMYTTTSSHMVLTAELEEKNVRIMIDCGANQNYASVELGQQMSRWMRNKKEPYPLTLADGTPISHGNGWVRRELHNVRLKLNDHEESMNLDITDMKYDIVLGMAWLQKHNPEIDWKARVLKFPNCSHRNEGVRSTPKVPFAKAIWVRPRGRALAGTSEPLPPEYQDFAELFRERIGEAALPEHKP